jgi:hypothetical protein
MKFWLLTLVVLVSTSPTLASAASFAKQSLFLSKTPVTEGETVLIHAVVANESTAKFSGDVVFKDAEAKIGSVAVTIAAGGANAVSISWKPTAGSHTITAQLTNGAGTAVESESATFVINEKPKPVTPLTISGTSSAASPVESSADIQKKITDLYPPAGSVSAPVFSTLDSVREKAAGALDNGINWAKQKTGGKNYGSVLGAATSTNDSGGIMGTVWLILGLVVLYIFTLLRFVVGNAGIFYPAFAILFFYILWRLFKRFRRPRYDVYE